ncbi:oxidoreductase [Penicillium herquei]|nr:oxidoreductase [Penicillium herquei]
MVLSKPNDDPVQKLFDLTGKVVAITGGARGIGLAVANAYAEAGAQIAILYRTTSTAPAITKEIASKYNTQSRAYQADVTVAKQISAAIDQVVKDFGKLDVIVANAGICSEHAAMDYTPEEFQDIMNVNVNGAFYTAQAAARIFQQQGFGNVVFTASVSATLVNTPQKQAAYNASKAGLLQLTKSLAVEWVEFCRVNCVSPGYVQTQIMEYASKEMLDTWLSQIPARRFASPYELKGVYLFCASDASSYMTGSNLVVDGGFTLP